MRLGGIHPANQVAYMHSASGKCFAVWPPPLDLWRSRSVIKFNREWCRTSMENPYETCCASKMHRWTRSTPRRGIPKSWQGKPRPAQCGAKWPQGTTSKTPLTRLRASQWRPQTPASVSGKEQKCYDWNTSYIVISSISTMLQYARIEYNWFAIVKYTHEATYGLTIALWWGLSWKVRWCTEARSLHCTRAGTDDIHKVPALVCVCLPALNLYKLASWKNPISL